ncbi:MAG: ABC transporter substrate-binding protein [Clostridia bacterium]|nr:ABC transporter substrate-binding protein [Clostridia bacterium]
MKKLNVVLAIIAVIAIAAACVFGIQKGIIQKDLDALKAQVQELESSLKQAQDDLQTARNELQSAQDEAAKAVEAAAKAAEEAEKAQSKTFKIGICNFVDDASLNQIIANIKSQLKEIAAQKNVTFEVKEENCNLDGSVMQQIIQNFISDDVDLMVGVATPVAMTMQAMTEDNQIPVVFAAVSDPLGAGLVESLEKPGANITGTSDYLDTNAVLNLIFAANPDASKIALLYNPAEDSSTAPIADAKKILAAKNITVKEYSGSNISEVILAADAIIADGMDAVFTPTDNTIMAAELSIYEKLAEAKIPHYTGADSFALNGAFLGYGVDYANLGKATADMIGNILVDGANIAQVPVKTFDNGTATVNTETAAAIGYDYDAIAAAFAPYCTTVQPITTAESFDDLAQ